MCIAYIRLKASTTSRLKIKVVEKILFSLCPYTINPRGIDRNVSGRIKRTISNKKILSTRIVNKKEI